MIKYQIAILFIISFGLHANPILDEPAEDILRAVRLSRIPTVITSLEERAIQKMESNDLLSAREDLKKAIQLKHAIGMKESEGNASLLLQISKLESRLGNRCEANQYSHLAKRIALRIGVNLGAVALDRAVIPETRKPEGCIEVSWLKE
ncbi:LEPBI_I1174 family sigma 54-regulated protein [Leptospira bandrabouensis]|uniref:Tetratricopeptide repeat protein n=1 Tax=Leptospira bandrabouensis TaxID=2484903 RepID=A0A6H3NVM1_9LEPT|nr:hypothetical protein [Leptospira bandrabouensis]MCG6152101.1 hypothetical protein [Leptospira bandrabouensis]MCW7459632.1 hypothetical protein [Leptospira bandrabouensis]MCW7477348.1 hypothetical protein [Leptospira bandrabouensis]MCW7485030.1 hypothetical protein [Leptospira bandrabouensis]TGN09318.1 hypothetical protein EHR07_01880 [Leptospira bandrabouensis]